MSARAFPKLRFVKTWMPSKGWRVGLNSRIPPGLRRGSQALPSEITRFDASGFVDVWARYVGTLSLGPTTLLHGDAHIENTYVLPDNKVGFLDWQVVRRGEWSQDIGYFLISALTPEDRRANEKSLLEEYRGALTIPNHERPSAETVWQRYCATPGYGLPI